MRFSSELFIILCLSMLFKITINVVFRRKNLERSIKLNDKREFTNNII